MKFKILNSWNLPSFGCLLVSMIIILTFSNNLLARDKKIETGNSAKNSSNYGKRYSNNILRGVKISDVYTFNDTETTRFGPAYANIWLEKSNFLACFPPTGRTISYALCYYSGPDQPTGNDPDNPSLGIVNLSAMGLWN